MGIHEVSSFPVVAQSQNMRIGLSDLFIEGIILACTVPISGTLLFGLPNKRGFMLSVTLLCSTGGGVLVLPGTALDRLIGHGPGGIGFGLLTMWQSGVALILGLLLAWARKLPTAARTDEIT